MSPRDPAFDLVTRIAALTLLALLFGCGNSPTEPGMAAFARPVNGEVFEPTPRATPVMRGPMPTPTPCAVSPYTDCGNPSPWPTPGPNATPTPTWDPCAPGHLHVTGSCPGEQTPTPTVTP